MRSSPSPAGGRAGAGRTPWRALPCWHPPHRGGRCRKRRPGLAVDAPGSGWRTPRPTRWPNCRPADARCPGHAPLPGQIRLVDPGTVACTWQG